MPQIPHAHLNAHPHTEGNQDAWAMIHDTGTKVDQFKEDIRQALASGINGFQMLTFAPDEVFQAAHEVYAETGQRFYIAPEWNGFFQLSDDEIATRIATFAQAHADDPAVYRHEGRQAHFTYGSVGEWAKTSEGVRSMRQRLEDAGAAVILVPTLRNFDRLALDRPDLINKPWPEPPVASEPVQWLDQSGWEGATGFMQTVPLPVRDLLDERISPDGEDFWWVPSIFTGYDSSNRPGQAIHTPAWGMRELYVNTLDWIDRGYRHFTYVTWNDSHESLLIPSSRNVWGYNTVLKFLHGIAGTGDSPFAQPKFALCYPVDTALGDDFFVQLIAMPAQGERYLRVRATVEMEPVGGTAGPAPVIKLEDELEAGEPAVFMETRQPTSGWRGTDAFQPHVSVEIQQAPGGPWKSVYDRLPLLVTRLRYNIVQFPVAYAADLDHIAPGTELNLALTPEGDLYKARVETDTDAPIQRLVLMEGTLSLGAFRPQDAEAPAHFDHTDLFVRIDASEKVPLSLTLSDGVIADLFSPYWKLDEAVVPVNTPTAQFSSRPKGDFTSRVARFSANDDCTVSLAAQGGDAPLTASLDELAAGPVSREVTVNGKSVALILTLTTDATEPNVDYPHPAKGTITRELPLYLPTYGTRVLQSQAWLSSGQVAYSNPVLLSQPVEPTAVQWIETGGIFDDFVPGDTEASLNPFSAGQVVTAQMDRTRVPYFHLDFEEAAGPRLNDHGTSQEMGRAWIEHGGPGTGHKARYDWNNAGQTRRIAGVSGQGIRLGTGTGVRFRSKSSPFGAETLSLWVHVSEGSAATPVWRTLTAGPVNLSLKGSGQADITLKRTRRQSAALQANAPLRPGWNHLIFVYDLTSFTAYLNGEPLGQQEGVSPAYQRTHQRPFIGFSQAATEGLGFDGGIDEVEVIGTGLDADAVAELTGDTSWR
jgi:hypothetical protein